MKASFTSRVESTLKADPCKVSAEPPAHYRRSLTSGHSTLTRRVDVAASTAGPIALAVAKHAVWPVLDSKFFDGVVAKAKDAALAYATDRALTAVKSVGSGIVSLMPGKKKGRALQVVQKYGQPAPGKGKLVLLPVGGGGAARRAPARRVAGSRRAAPGRSGPKMRTFSVPVARARTSTTRAPSVGGRGPVVISHTEYLQEVSGSVGYNVTSIPVNPGLPGSFPWLANIASQYEEYRVKSLRYRFETEASSSVKGAVILVTDVDALDSAFQSKQQAMDYRGASRTAPWQRVTHNAQAAARSPYGARFVRAGTVPTGGDLKTYDVGLFQVITQGMADTSIVGELYVDYTFEFIGPKVNNVLGQTLLGADVRSGGTVTPAAPLGSAPTVVAGSNIPVVVNNNSVTLQFTGRLLISLVVLGTGITVASVAPAGGATAAVIYGNAITATQALACLSVDMIANVGQGLTINVTATTVTNTYLIIQQMSSGLLVTKKPPPTASLPLWTPPDPLLEKIARLEAILARARLLDDDERRPPASSQLAPFSAQTGMTGY